MKLIVLLLIVFSISCSKQSKSITKVSFSFKGPPENAKAWGVTSPTAIGGYNCFGVFIRHPEIPPQSSCNNSSGNEVINMDISVGSVPLGGILEAQVMEGAGRIFTVVGFKASAGFSCPDFNQDIHSQEDHLSAPAILGQTTVDVAGASQQVIITASYANKVEFQDCHGNNFGDFAGFDPSKFTITYSEENGLYTQGVAITSNIPSVQGFTPTNFTISPSLPTGLTLDASTGIISGIPTATSSLMGYSVQASDSLGNMLHGFVRIFVASPSGYYTVDDDGDGGYDGAADGTCTSPCTLRRAVDEINNAGTPKPILIPAGRMITVGTPINLNYAAPFEILGTGIDSATVSGGGSVQVFNNTADPTFVSMAGFNIANGFISGGDGGAINFMTAGVVNVSIQGMKFYNNQTSGASGNGGAIYFDPEITGMISDSIFLNNSAAATGGSGGAINTDGILEIQYVAFESNTAPNGNGGAILSDTATASISIVDSYFKANTTAGNGGAIDFISPMVGTGQFIRNSTFQANTAANGGAIYLTEITTFPIFENLTFEGNVATTQGGHIYAGGTGQVLSCLNCTLVNGVVQAANGGAGIASIGGISVSVKNSIFYYNRDTTVNDDCFNSGSTMLFDDNLTDSGSDGGASDCDYASGTANVESTDPLLMPIQFMGPLTPVMIPSFDSPAIDSGNNSTCTATDQIFNNRPLDGDGDASAICDKGAVEFNTGP